jgi:Predicted membrane protein (DUF2254)
VLAHVSSYIRAIDEAGLLEAARAHDAGLRVDRTIGQFVADGSPLLEVSPPGRSTAALRAACRWAFDVDPARTMEQDVEFGVLQIVDIALKAISPAVNDPTTALTCVDQLGEPPGATLHDTEGGARVALRRTSFPRLLDVACSQIRHYGSRAGHLDGEHPLLRCDPQPGESNGGRLCPRSPRRPGRDERAPRDCCTDCGGPYDEQDAAGCLSDGTAKLLTPCGRVLVEGVTSCPNAVLDGSCMSQDVEGQSHLYGWMTSVPTCPDPQPEGQNPKLLPVGQPSFISPPRQQGLRFDEGHSRQRHPCGERAGDPPSHLRRTGS